MHASAACHRQRMEQLQPDSSSQAVITPLYIPCLRPLQLVCGSSSKRRLLPPLASPHKWVSGKKGMRCCRQLFTAADGPARTAALEFWLQSMEKVSRLCLAQVYLARQPVSAAESLPVVFAGCLYAGFGPAERCKAAALGLRLARRQQLRLEACTAAAAPPRGMEVEATQVGWASLWR